MKKEEVKKELIAIGNVYHGLLCSSYVGNKDYDNFVKESYEKYINEKIDMFVDDEGHIKTKGRYIHNLGNDTIVIQDEKNGNVIEFRGKYDIKEYDSFLQNNKYIQELLEDKKLAILSNEEKDEVLQEMNRNKESLREKPIKNPLIMDEDIEEHLRGTGEPVGEEIDLNKVSFSKDDYNPNESPHMGMMELMKMIDKEEESKKSKNKKKFKQETQDLTKMEEKNKKNKKNEKSIYDQLKLYKYKNYESLSQQKRAWITIKARKQGKDPEKVREDIKWKMGNKNFIDMFKIDKK